MAADEKLVQEALNARSGDFRAYDQLVLKHQGMVRTNCRFISGNEDDAQDLAQEVFVKAYFNLKSFQGKSQFGTWIKRIKVNHCLNHLRKQKGKTHVDIEEPGLNAEPQLQDSRQTSAATEDRERREMISRTLDGLSENLRVPLIMRDMDGLSYQEIADHLGVGLSATKMRINRARQEFRARYQGA
jgi:RNA polymerase sigma-70 factor, ECF subfamily